MYFNICLKVRFVLLVVGVVMVVVAFILYSSLHHQHSTVTHSGHIYSESYGFSAIHLEFHYVLNNKF